MKLTILCSTMGVVFTSIASVFGGWSESLTTLLIFMVADYISGIVLAGVFHKSAKTETGTLKSSTCLQGLIKKGMMLVIVVVAYRLDLLTGSSYIKDGVCFALLVNELISIVENLGLMGVPIPKQITNAIQLLKEKEE